MAGKSKDAARRDSIRDWGEVLCEWGEEMKGFADSDEETERLPPRREDVVGLLTSQMWHEAYSHGVGRGRREVYKRMKAQVAKLEAEVLRLTKDSQKQEALF